MMCVFGGLFSGLIFCICVFVFVYFVFYIVVLHCNMLHCFDVQYADCVFFCWHLLLLLIPLVCFVIVVWYFVFRICILEAMNWD